jgi:hypothetical protein
MMRRNDEIVNEMEFRMLSACNGLSSHLPATAMKGFFQSIRRPWRGLLTAESDRYERPKPPERQYRYLPVNDEKFLSELQRAADWPTARKVLPEPIKIADHLAQL